MTRRDETRRAVVHYGSTSVTDVWGVLVSESWFKASYKYQAAVHHSYTKSHRFDSTACLSVLGGNIWLSPVSHLPDDHLAEVETCGRDIWDRLVFIIDSSFCCMNWCIITYVIALCIYCVLFGTRYGSCALDNVDNATSWTTISFSRPVLHKVNYLVQSSSSMSYLVSQSTSLFSY
jgi:hypothetical protein